jgi:hypothetical protein
MILSEETLRYPASFWCPSPLIHTGIKYDIVRRNTNIYIDIVFSFSINIYLYNLILSEKTKMSSSILLSLSIYAYLYNMILSGETIRYPAA